jgi:hypothetical protein
MIMRLSEEIDQLLDDELEAHPVLVRFESGAYRGSSKSEMIKLLTSLIDVLISRDRAIVNAIRRIADELDESESIEVSPRRVAVGGDGSSLRSNLEGALEQLAARGHIPQEGEREITIRIDGHGQIKWFEATRIRVPASGLDETGFRSPPPIEGGGLSEVSDSH